MKASGAPSAKPWTRWPCSRQRRVGWRSAPRTGRSPSGEVLPTGYRDVGKGGVCFARVPARRGLLGRDDRGARAAEWLVEALAGLQVVLDRAHVERDRLLRRVVDFLLRRARHEHFRARRVPDRALVAAAAEGLSPLLPRVPARLVLPVVVLAGESEVRFPPDDLLLQVEADPPESHADLDREGGGVPHVGRVERGGEFKVIAPVSLRISGVLRVLVALLAHVGALGKTQTVQPCAVAPLHVEFDPVRRIGEQEPWRGICEHLADIVGVRGVPAEEPVVSEDPEVARSGHRLLRGLGCLVLDDAVEAGFEEGVELQFLELQWRVCRDLSEDRLEAVGELAGDGRVVQRQVEGLLLGLRQIHDDDLGLGLSERFQGVDSLVTSYNVTAGTVPDYRLDEPEPADAGAEPARRLLRNSARIKRRRCERRELHHAYFGFLALGHADALRSIHRSRPLSLKP